jgi:hypothetical protein
MSLSSDAIEQASKGKSAISNGTRLFIDGLDGRSALARRYRDLVGEFVSDLGGAEVISEAQRAIIRRAASLCVWCEAVEVRLAAGEEIEITPYTTAANSLRRLLVDIGLERRARDVTPICARRMIPPDDPFWPFLRRGLHRSASLWSLV